MSALTIALAVSLPLVPGWAEEAPPKLQASAQRADTRIQIMAQRDRAIVDITCGFGIDKATLQRQSDAWPKSVVVHLHLKGLESFKASNGEVTVEAACDERSSRTTLWRGREEIPLEPGDPSWVDVRAVGGDGATPLQKGYFQVRLPAKLFEANPEAITLEWVDFFRG